MVCMPCLPRCLGTLLLLRSWHADSPRIASCSNACCRARGVTSTGRTVGQLSLQTASPRRNSSTCCSSRRRASRCALAPASARGVAALCIACCVRAHLTHDCMDPPLLAGQSGPLRTFAHVTSPVVGALTLKYSAQGFIRNKHRMIYTLRALYNFRFHYLARGGYIYIRQ